MRCSTTRYRKGGKSKLEDSCSGQRLLARFTSHLTSVVFESSEGKLKFYLNVLCFIKFYDVKVKS